nr:ribosomal protein S16 [Zygophyllum kansuense]UJH21851.1 ribosomal protein S16 [Zygophyllum kansuense]
MKNIDELN